MKQALLVIDAQQDLMDGSEGNEAVYQKEKLIQTINFVIGKARELEVPILFIRDQDVASGEGKGFQVHKDITMPENCPFFDKKATNAFYSTGWNT